MKQGARSRESARNQKPEGRSQEARSLIDPSKSLPTHGGIGMTSGGRLSRPALYALGGDQIAEQSRQLTESKRRGLARLITIIHGGRACEKSACFTSQAAGPRRKSLS